MSLIVSRAFGLSLVACVAAASFSFACTSSDSDEPATGGNSDGGGADDDDDTNDDAGGGGTGGFRQCHGSGESSCTQAELNIYGSCIDQACSATFAECYGPDYKSGTFAGICGAAFKCFNDCPCGDTACFAACPAPSEECLACGEKVGTCTSQCEAPACLENDRDAGSGSGKSCADLQTCCDGLSGDDKDICVLGLQQANGNDVVCSGIYAAVCP